MKIDEFVSNGAKRAAYRKIMIIQALTKEPPKQKPTTGAQNQKLMGTFPLSCYDSPLAPPHTKSKHIREQPA